MEVWRRIPSLPKYEASTEGRIREFRGKRVLPTYPDAYGSLIVNTCYCGVQSTKRVARLVGEAWSRAFKPHLRPIHRDGNRSNCAPTNLKWVPVSQVSRPPHSRNPKPTKKETPQCQQD